jgi:hypothetical protein
MNECILSFGFSSKNKTGDRGILVAKTWTDGSVPFFIILCDLENCWMKIYLHDKKLKKYFKLKRDGERKKQTLAFNYHFWDLTEALTIRKNFYGRKTNEPI